MDFFSDLVTISDFNFSKIWKVTIFLSQPRYSTILAGTNLLLSGCITKPSFWNKCIVSTTVKIHSSKPWSVAITSLMFFAAVYPGLFSSTNPSMTIHVNSRTVVDKIICSMFACWANFSNFYLEIFYLRIFYLFKCPFKLAKERLTISLWKCEYCLIWALFALHKKWSFPLRISSVNVPSTQFPADLVTFTEEMFNGKLHFLCSVSSNSLKVSVLCDMNSQKSFYYSFIWKELLENVSIVC